MTTRRLFVGGSLAALVAPPMVLAQYTDKVRRIGVLTFGSPEPFATEFRRALAALGKVDGREVVIEHRWADGQAERLDAAAAELVRADVAVIVARATPSVEAAMKASRDIPIVMATAGDALRTGLVASLARPGGNVTGLSLAVVTLAGKAVELLRDTLPRAARFAGIADRKDPLHREFVAETGATASKLGLEWRAVVLDGAGELDAALGSLARDRFDGVVIQPIFAVDPKTRATVARLALKHRLPTVSGLRSYAEAGGMIAYASEFDDLPSRAALYVDRILRGAHPRDLPVEQPARFQLVFNVATARALGVRIPQSMLQRADLVIE